MAGLRSPVFCNPRQFPPVCPLHLGGSSPYRPAISLLRLDLGYATIQLDAWRRNRRISSVKKSRADAHMIHAMGTEAGQTMAPTVKTSPSPVTDLWNKTTWLKRRFLWLKRFCDEKRAFFPWKRDVGLRLMENACDCRLYSMAILTEVLNIWRNADAVCFDVDSTVCIDEGIDELAEFCGAGEAVADWTSRAMGGSVPFEEALAARLSLFRPSMSDVANYLHSNPPSDFPVHETCVLGTARLNSGIQHLVKLLKAKGVDVYLVSGGFRQMIEPVAALLDIPNKNVYANRLLFGNLGEFVGFDTEEPTSRSGGKSTAVEQIKKECGYQTLVMVGDGATDLEARRPGGADVFICYGGVQLRTNVAEAADWLVLSFDDLIKELDSTT